MIFILTPDGIFAIRRGFHGSDDSSDFSEPDEIEGVDNWHMALAGHRRLLVMASKDFDLNRRAKTPGPGLRNQQPAAATSSSSSTTINRISNEPEQPSSLFPLVDLSQQNMVTLHQIDQFLQRAVNNTRSMCLAGKFLLCRSIAPSFENCERGDVNLLVDDPDGQLAAPLRLLNFGVNLPGSGFLCNSNRRSVPVGAIVALMNPNVHRDRNGNMILRCQNPAHFVVLGCEHPLVKAGCCHFRAKLPYPSGMNQDASFIDANKAGEAYARDKNYPMAFCCFDRAIEEKRDDACVTYLNRAAAYLATGQSFLALEDAERGLALEPANEAVGDSLRLLKARSLFLLKNYRQCADFLAENPGQGEIWQNLRLAVETALEESQFGRYDLVKMRQEIETNKSPYLVNHADYFAYDLVEPSKLVVKIDIESGTLLMAYRAFVFHPVQSSSSNNKAHELTTMIFSKMSTDPVGTKLELGKNHRQPASFDDPVQLAGFVEDEALLAVDYFSTDQQDLVKGCGIWPSPPNHLKVSCLKANCARSYIGDFVFVVAVKKISKGDQLATFKVARDRLQTPFVQSRDVCDCDMCSLDHDEPEQCRLKFAMAERALEEQMVLLNLSRPTKAMLENGVEALIVALKGLKRSQQTMDGTTSFLMHKMRSTIAQLYAKLRDFKMATTYMEEAVRAYDEMALLPEALRCADMLSTWFAQIPGNRGVKKSAEWRQRKSDYAKILCGDRVYN